MDIIYARGESSVAEVREAMTDRPSYSAVRTLMTILVQKGHLRHRAEGMKYVYSPTRSRKEVSQAAAQRLLKTFFDGSVADAVAALFDASQSKLSPEELRRLDGLIQKARKDGR
jgi:predicted transcriptional regulator